MPAIRPISRPIRRWVRYQDLPANPWPDVCLYCPLCEETYSACAGDYFTQAPSDVCECAMCDEPLRLVRKVTTYQDVR